jgi:hypothetical protein
MYQVKARTREYSRKAVRELLMEAFDDDALNNFCVDYFNAVYQRFTDGQTKDQRVRLLLDHASQREQIEELVARIRDANEPMYRKYESRLRSTLTRDKTDWLPTSDFTGVPIDKLQDDVERLNAYVDLFAKVRTACDKLAALKMVVKEGLKHSEGDWWRASYIRSFIDAQLTPASEEVGTALSGYARDLDAFDSCLVGNYCKEVRDKSGQLKAAWDHGAGDITTSILNDRDNHLRPASRDAAKERIVDQMIALDNLLVQDMEETANDVAEELYEGIRFLATVLADRLGIEVDRRFGIGE